MEIIMRWLSRVKASTREAYGSELRRFYEWTGGKCLAEIGEAVLIAYRIHLTKEGYAVNTRNKTMAALRSLFNFAYKDGYIHKHPGALLRAEDGDRTLTDRYVDTDLIQRLFVAAERMGSALEIRFLYYTGCRRGEMAALKWADIAEMGGGGYVTFKVTKSGKPRTVRLSDKLWKALEKHRGPADQHVFPSDETIYRHVREAFIAAGIQHGSPHWLRHAHAFHALQSNVPLNVLQATLGHANLQSTTAYVHARPDESSGNYLEEF